MLSLPTGFKPGFCLDENAKPPTKGRITKSEVHTQEECAEYCKKQSIAVACEYQLKTMVCDALIHAVAKHTDGNSNGVCSIIIPAGLLFLSVNGI